MNFPSWFVARLLALMLASGCSLGLSPACSWFPSFEYRDVSLACYGPLVTAVPRLLPATLQTLLLSGTGLRALDGDAFRRRQLPRLRHLTITDGALTSVAGGALCPLTALVLLDLSNNDLHQVDASSFQCNRNLRRVDLSDNPGLGRLPALVSDTVEILDADRCNISDVGVGDLQGLPNLTVLHLHGNPDLDCWAAKTRLSRTRPSLVVICEDSVSSAPPTNNISKSQPPSGASVHLPQHATSTEADFENSVTRLHVESNKVGSVLTSTETVKGLEIDFQNSVTLPIEDQKLGTVIKSVSDIATEVPIKQRAESNERSPHAFVKINNENMIVVTRPKEFNKLDSIFLTSMSVLLPLILLLSLLICCLKCKVTAN